MAVFWCAALSVWVLAFTCVKGVFFKDCHTPGLDGNVTELNLDSEENKTLTCSGIRRDKAVRWLLRPRSGGSSADLPDLPAGSCTADGQCGTSQTNVDFFFPERNGEKSTMTIQDHPYQRLLENSILYCAGGEGTIAACQIDLIRPARGTCQAVLETSSKTLTVRVQCNVTQGNSTRQRYHCVLYEQNGESQSWSKIGDTKMTENTLPSGSARCDFMQTVNTSVLDSQRHLQLRYQVQLFPGQENVNVTGDMTMELPNQPRIFECPPEDLVAENQNLTCQCQSDNIGRPAGHLVWSMKPTKGEIKIISQAEKGVRTLGLNTGPLKRQDHGAKVRCVVVWADREFKEQRQVQVGYPPSSVSLQISPGKDMEEGSSAEFNCSVPDGRPDPNLKLSKGSKEMSTARTQTLTHLKQSLRCEDTGEYTCTAQNGFGPEKIATAKLNVTCSPRGLSTRIDPVLYEDEGVQFSFDLVANPTPFMVTFGFLGASSESNSTSKVEGILLSGECRPKGGGGGGGGREGDAKAEAEVTCTVTVSNVTSSGAQGFYRGDVSNGKGTLHFDFEVKLNATRVDPGSKGIPEMMAVGIGIGLAVIVIAVVVVVILFRFRRKRGSKERVAFRKENAVNARTTTTPTATNTTTTNTTNTNNTACSPRNDDEDDDNNDEENNHDKDHHHLPATRPLLSTAALPLSLPLSSPPRGPSLEVYAVVQKKPKTSTITNAEGEEEVKTPSPGKGSDREPQPTDVYVLVDKHKSQQKQQQKQKQKQQKQKKQKKQKQRKTLAEVAETGPGKEEEEERLDEGGDHVYGNINASFGSPEGYGNDVPLAAEGGDSGHEYNQDGLLYVSMDFANVPSAPRPMPSPSEDGVLYSAVDFGRTTSK